MSSCVQKECSCTYVLFFFLFQTLFFSRPNICILRRHLHWNSLIQWSTCPQQTWCNFASALRAPCIWRAPTRVWGSIERGTHTHTYIYIYMYVLEMCENHAINYVTMPSAFRQVGGYPDPQGDALLPSARHGQNNSWNDLLGVCKVIVLEICQCRCGL